MSEDVDSFIDSDSFTDQKLVSMVREGKRLSSLTLLRYLSRGIVNMSSMHTPKAEVIRELLDAGAVPFHFSKGDEWETLLQNDIRLYMPFALRSTINLAALLHDRAIMDLLVSAGEDLNDYTATFL